MTKSFKNLLENLINSIDETNEELIKNIFSAEYVFACVQQNITYDSFYTILSSKWNKIVDELVSEKDNCISISELYHGEKTLKQLNNIPTGSIQTPESVINNIKSYFTKYLDDNHQEDDEIAFKMFDALRDLLVTDDIYINTNLMTTLINMGNLIKTRSVCWLWDIIILSASSKIKAEFPIYDKNSLEVKQKVNLMLRTYMNEIKSMLKNINEDSSNSFFNKTLDVTTNNLTQSYEMTKVNPLNSDSNASFIEKELDRMIPETIGPLKCFFVDLIQYYYSIDTLHPIVWAQILRSMLVNFLTNPPMTKDELFQFFSKNLLLNSGPFILKILQQVRPIMSEEQRKKYNLSKLTYPKMTKSQYTLILSRIVKNWDSYKLLYDASASVGHVFFLQHAITMEKIVVKVAKPLSIIQSCYEYSKLNDFFEKGTLEQQFVHNMLYSTGKELQTQNEIKNINYGNKIYKMNYNELYTNTDINASLTTITVKENIIVDNCWFALSMSVAPGIPLSKIFETRGPYDLSRDTVYRSNLHRCFDLVIFKFFSNIIKNGFYHGDLHSGNVYFSYTDEPTREAKITLIDFGATGTIDIFNDDPDINDLIKIIIQSIFYNYDNLFDTLVDLLNRKNVNSTTINKTSDDYKNFKNKLKKIRVTNIYNSTKNSKVDEIYTQSCLTSKVRTDKEKLFHENHIANIAKEKNTHHAKCYYSSNNNVTINISKQEDTVKKSIDSLYDYVDIHKFINKNNQTTEQIDNSEPLPAYDCNIEIVGNIISFTEVMGMIMEFCTKSNVNIPITIPDLYELFKAYILISGLTTQMNYDSLRMSIVIKKILFEYENITNVVKHPIIALKMYSVYEIENKKYNKLLEQIIDLQNKRNSIEENLEKINND